MNLVVSWLLSAMVLSIKVFEMESFIFFRSSCSDLVGVDVNDFLAYHIELRKLASDLELKYIVFSDISQMLHKTENLKVGSRIALVDLESERTMLMRYQSAEWHEATKNDPSAVPVFDANLLRVYQGFIRFLEKDLGDSEALVCKSRSARKKYFSSVAKEMMRRGDVSGCTARVFNGISTSFSVFQIWCLVHFHVIYVYPFMVMTTPVPNFPSNYFRASSND